MTKWEFKPMEKIDGIWTREFDLLPGFYLYNFEVDEGDLEYDPKEPTLSIGGETFNIICVGTNFPLYMAHHLYQVMFKLTTSDCIKEVDTFLQKYPGFINECFYYADEEHDGYGTFLHWACLYKREKVVALLISKNANLSLSFHDHYDDLGYEGFQYHTPFEIATAMNNQKIVDIFLRSWPKTHNLLPPDIQFSIEEILVCMNKIYDSPKELRTMIICSLLKWIGVVILGILLKYCTQI